MHSVKQYLYFILLGLGILFFPGPGHAQYQNVWAFGRNAGMDFNSGAAVGIKTAIATNEGSASVCDARGQLLFYTDGTSLWDRQHNLMPNGSDLTGMGEYATTSTTQAALIVPMPGNEDQYYVFSLGSVEMTSSGRLWYCIVDRKANNGLGDVVQGKKTIVVDSGLTEKMMAIPGNDCNLWLVVVPFYGDVVKAYNIGLEGIGADPVISSKTNKDRQDIISGWMDVSPDRSRIILGKGLYTFTPATGQLSNPVLLPVGTNYGVCFSPDNSKLYLSGAQMLQFNLSSGDSGKIAASGTLIGDATYRVMRRGPDGKIYLRGETMGRMSIIPFPDRNGRACGFLEDSLALFPETGTSISLPNYIVHATDRNRNFFTSKTDTAFCVSDKLLAAGNVNGTGYVWNTGHRSATLQVNTSGTYWVRYQVNSVCTVDDFVDTIKVFFDFNPRGVSTLTEKELMCRADTLLIGTENQWGADYLWEDGSTGNRRMVREPGVYWLRYEVDTFCTQHVDSFVIRYTKDDFQVSFMADTLLCEKENSVLQNASSAAFEQLNWYFGDGTEGKGGNPQHSYAEEGSYEVMLVGTRHEVCRDTAYKTLVVDAPQELRYTADRTAICVGESVTFVPNIPGNTLTQLNWKFGDSVTLDTDNNGKVQHAYESWGDRVVMSIARFRACPESIYTDTVRVFPFPDVDLGRDSSLCLNGRAVLLRNTVVMALGRFFYLWNTGATTQEIQVTHPGIYRLTIRSELADCSSSETVSVRNDCYLDIPNAFSPDADGYNDYFFPRQLLSSGISNFQLQVFNRWGQLLFETRDKEGRGWDGRFNGREQPAGTYVYRLAGQFVNGSAEVYEGNVTLLR